MLSGWKRMPRGPRDPLKMSERENDIKVVRMNRKNFKY